MNNKAAMTKTSNRERLHDIIDDLLTKKRIDRSKFFQALELVHDIARDCSEQCNRLIQENAALRERNNKLSWLVIRQETAISGKYQEHHA